MNKCIITSLMLAVAPAQAKALERFGQTEAATRAWSILAKNYEGTAAGKAAEKYIARLKKGK